MHKLFTWINETSPGGVDFVNTERIRDIKALVPFTYRENNYLDNYILNFIPRDCVDVGPVNFLCDRKVIEYNLNKNYPASVATYFGLIQIANCGDGAPILLNCANGYIIHVENGTIQDEGIEIFDKLPSGEFLPFSNQGFMVAATKNWKNIDLFCDWILDGLQNDKSFDSL